MTNKKFNEEKIINVLQEAEGDNTVRDVCRKHQNTEQTFYHWRNKFGSMTVLEVRRLKELEHDNAQLRQIVADLMLEIGFCETSIKTSGEAVGGPSNGGLCQF